MSDFVPNIDVIWDKFQNLFYRFIIEINPGELKKTTAKIASVNEVPD